MARINAGDSGGTSDGGGSSDNGSGDGDGDSGGRTYDWSSYRERQRRREEETQEPEQTQDTQQSSTSDVGQQGQGGGLDAVQQEAQQQRQSQEQQRQQQQQAEQTTQVGETTVGASGPGVGATEPDVRQGVEQTGTGRVQEAARGLEQQALNQTGLESQGAIRVTQDGDQLRTELTTLGERRLEERAASDIEGQLESGFENTLRTRRVEQDRARALAVEQSGELVTEQETPSVDLTGDVELQDNTFEVTDEGQQEIQGAQAEFVSSQLGFPLGAEDITEDGEISETGQESIEAQRSAEFQDRNTEIIREINKATTARTATQERALFDAQETIEQAQDIEQSAAADQAIVGQAKARNTLREQAADAYSDQLGFDVPGSAVDITTTDTPSGTQLEPSLDTEAAKEAGRGQNDIFSTFVGGVETVAPFDVPGGGNMANVQSVEEFEGESGITGTLPEGPGDMLSGGAQWFSENIGQPTGDITGDFFDMAGAAARMSNVADPLAAGGTPTDPAGSGKEVDLTREFELFGPRVGDVARAPDDEVTESGSYERLGEGAGTAAAEIFNAPGYADIAYTGADVFATGAKRSVVDNDGIGFYQDLAGATALAGVEATEMAVENPARTTGALAGGAFGAIGVGSAAKSAFTATRGRLATRGLDIQDEVPIENIERPDVRSGESGGLTRLSTKAAPEGDLAIPPNRLPAKAADTPAKEVRNLADEFDDPRIRSQLDTGPGESVVFRAVSGRKPERYEPRSRRPYDPDATFLAPTVARNFLDVDPSGGASSGFRLPRPVKATKSLVGAARGEGVPNIVATAGKVEPLPESAQSRAAITDFLQENRNTGKFYAPTNKGRQQTVTGESEVFVSAEGATSTESMWGWGKFYDPDEMEGTGVVESGETTEFVEVGQPLQTRIRGERVPIQMFRQDTGDVTPLSEQGGLGAARANMENRIGSLFGDERGQMTLAGSQGRIGQTSRSNRAPSSEGTPTTPYRPGGQPGTPVVPTNPFGFDGGAFGTQPTDTVRTDNTDLFGDGQDARTPGRARDSNRPRDTDATATSGFGTMSGLFGGSSTMLFGGSEQTATVSDSTSQTTGGTGGTPSGTPTRTPTELFGSPGGSPTGGPSQPGQTPPSQPETPSFNTPTPPGSPTFGTPTISTPTWNTPGENTPVWNVPTTTTPGDPWTPRQPQSDSDDDRKENPFGEIGREGQDYQNPLVSGSSFLGIGVGFGGGGVNGQRDSQPQNGMFFGQADTAGTGEIFGLGGQRDGEQENLGPFGGMF